MLVVIIIEVKSKLIRVKQILLYVCLQLINGWFYIESILDEFILECIDKYCLVLYLRQNVNIVRFCPCV